MWNQRYYCRKKLIYMNIQYIKPLKLFFLFASSLNQKSFEVKQFIFNHLSWLIAKDYFNWYMFLLNGSCLFGVSFTSHPQFVHSFGLFILFYCCSLWFISLRFIWYCYSLWFVIFYCNSLWFIIWYCCSLRFTLFCSSLRFITLYWYSLWFILLHSKYNIFFLCFVAVYYFFLLFCWDIIFFSFVLLEYNIFFLLFG